MIVCLKSTQSDAKQFEQWCWRYRGVLVNVASPTCQPYYTSREFPPEYKEYAHPVDIDACKNMVTCPLRNLDDIDKADMQSATVLLGLTPTIISYVGPTVVDIALLSSSRPENVLLLTQHCSENNPEEYTELENMAGSISKTHQD